MERTEGRGPDAAIQCAGGLAISEGLELVRPGGRFVSVGAGAGNISVPMRTLSTKYLSVFGIVAGEARHYYQALKFLSAHQYQFSFDRLLSRSYSLREVTDALQSMEDLQDIIPVIVPSGI